MYLNASETITSATQPNQQADSKCHSLVQTSPWMDGLSLALAAPFENSPGHSEVTRHRLRQKTGWHKAAPHLAALRDSGNQRWRLQANPLLTHGAQTKCLKMPRRNLATQTPCQVSCKRWLSLAAGALWPFHCCTSAPLTPNPISTSYQCLVKCMHATIPCKQFGKDVHAPTRT